MEKDLFVINKKKNTPPQKKSLSKVAVLTVSVSNSCHF